MPQIKLITTPNPLLFSDKMARWSIPTLKGEKDGVEGVLSPVMVIEPNPTVISFISSAKTNGGNTVFWTPPAGKALLIKRVVAVLSPDCATAAGVICYVSASSPTDVIITFAIGTAPVGTAPVILEFSMPEPGILFPVGSTLNILHTFALTAGRVDYTVFGAYV